jgi:multidrug resistance efflux pump
MAESRRFAIDVERCRLHELELRVTLETDQTTLEFLKLQADLFGGLSDKRAASQLQFRSVEAQHAALARKCAENLELLAQVEVELQHAQQRNEAFNQDQPPPAKLDEALEPMRAALTVQERRIDELSVDRSMLVLTSPMDGIVSEVLRGVGETLLTGEPILTVTASQPSEIIAYASPTQVDRLPAGTTLRLEVTRDGKHRRVAESRVDAVGPTAEQLPMRLWRNPTAPEWGWPIKIQLPTELAALGDELVGVRDD